MFSFFSYLFFLLIPLALVLIVRLKRRQRVVYSHTFLRSFEDERLLDYLLRTFRIYYDVLFDLIIAVILALFFSQVVRFTPQPTAICIDGSYSMIRADGQTALERAVTRALEENAGRERRRLFLLAWDRQRGKTRVFRLREPKIPPETDRAARAGIIRSYSDRLQQEHSFFNMDISALQELFDRGYRKVVFITDRFTSGNTNLEVVQVGNDESPFFYPASVYYDFSSAGFQILMYRSGYQRQIAVLRYDDQLENYKVVPAAEQSIPGSDLHTIEIEEEGLYRILGPGLDYIFNLKIPRHTVETSGAYSRLLTDVLPQLESGQSQILIADLAYAGEGKRELARRIRALGRHPHRYVTLIPESTVAARALIYPLELSFSQPAYAELPSKFEAAANRPGGSTRLFFLDPQHSRDGQTPLVYLSYLEADHPREFSQNEDLTQRGWRISEPHSGSTSLVYGRQDELRALNLASREFFPLSPQTDLTFELRRVNHLPYFLILLVLYLTKISFLARFQRRW